MQPYITEGLTRKFCLWVSLFFSGPVDSGISLHMAVFQESFFFIPISSGISVYISAAGGRTILWGICERS